MLLGGRFEYLLFSFLLGGGKGGAPVRQEGARFGFPEGPTIKKI